VHAVGDRQLLSSKEAFLGTFIWPTNWQYTPYVLPLLGSALLTSIVGLHAWQQRRVPGAGTFAITLLLITLWSVTNALEMAGADLPTKIFWANVQFLSYCGTPIGWLIMTLQYTGREEWLTRRRFAFLLVVPMITIVLVWTNDFHGLIRHDIYLDRNGAFPVVGKTYGLWFFAHAAYSYLLLLATLPLLIEALVNALALYRAQILALLAGVFLPILWNVSYVLGFSPVRRFDMTPIFMGMGGVIVAWGLLRHRLFDVVLVAHDRVIESMSDGVVVRDARRQVVHLNPAAAKILGKPLAEARGLPATQLLGIPSDHAWLSPITSEGRTELLLGSNGRKRYYEAQSSPLNTRRGSPIGQVIVLHDITDRKQSEESLIYASFHDILTGLHNRAYLEKEMQRLEREGCYPITVVCLDIDDLKLTNDTLGHERGDELLKAWAHVLRSSLRESDLVARIGGDEFAIVLPHTGEETGLAICKRLEEQVAVHNRSHHNLPLSVSWGAETAFDSDLSLEQAFKIADRNMYRHKLLHKVKGRDYLIDALLAEVAGKDQQAEKYVRLLQGLGPRPNQTRGLPETGDLLSSWPPETHNPNRR